jgi:hypothetical protein
VRVRTALCVSPPARYSRAEGKSRRLGPGVQGEVPRGFIPTVGLGQRRSRGARAGPFMPKSSAPVVRESVGGGGSDAPGPPTGETFMRTCVSDERLTVGAPCRSSRAEGARAGCG